MVPENRASTTGFNCYREVFFHFENLLTCRATWGSGGFPVTQCIQQREGTCAMTVLPRDWWWAEVIQTIEGSGRGT